MTTPATREETVEKLTSDCATVSWAHIQPHFERDAVIIVDSTLDFISVGTAIALDDSAAITEYINSAKLIKPTLEQTKIWNDTGYCFNCLIVRPYVIIQHIL